MSDGKPNWLLLFPDQHRWDWLGLYGEVPVRTPNVDALAGRGVAFTQVTCSTPLCAPSRASLASGKRTHRTGVPNHDYDYPTDKPTYQKMLREAGYRVGAVGKTDLHKKTKWYGLDGWTEFCGKVGFTETVDSAGKWDAVESGWPEPKDPYMAYLHRKGLAKVHVEDFFARKRAAGVPAHPTPLDREHYSDDWIGRNGIEMLRNFPRGAPWHLAVNFTGPHEPFDAPRELLDRWSNVEFELPRAVPEGADDLAPEEHLAVRRNYAAMLEGIDEWVGRFVAEVERRGELDNTFIVYASDHGEMLGDHGLWGKKVFYEPSVRVPLVVAGPQVAGSGALSDALVELPDAAATFLEVAGIGVSEDWDARSFLKVLRGDAETHRDAQVSMLEGRAMIFDGRMKLIAGAGETELYDLHEDPCEEKNLADMREREVDRLSRLLRQEIGA